MSAEERARERIDGFPHDPAARAPGGPALTRPEPQPPDDWSALLLARLEGLLCEICPEISGYEATIPGMVPAAALRVAFVLAHEFELGVEPAWRAEAKRLEAQMLGVGRKHLQLLEERQADERAIRILGAHQEDNRAEIARLLQDQTDNRAIIRYLEGKAGIS